MAELSAAFFKQAKWLFHVEQTSRCLTVPSEIVCGAEIILKISLNLHCPCFVSTETKPMSAQPGWKRPPHRQVQGSRDGARQCHAHPRTSWWSSGSPTADDVGWGTPPGVTFLSREVEESPLGADLLCPASLYQGKALLGDPVL